jgi:hypothetical protein
VSGSGASRGDRSALVLAALLLVLGTVGIGCASVGPEDKLAAAAETTAALPEEERIGRWALTVRSLELTPSNPTGAGPRGRADTLGPERTVYIRSAVSGSEGRYLYVTAGPDVSEGGWADAADIAVLPVYAVVRPGGEPVVLTDTPAGETAAALIRKETFLEIDDLESGGKREGSTAGTGTAAAAYHAVLDDGRTGWLLPGDIAFFDPFYPRVLRLTEGFSFPLPAADRKTVESVHGDPERHEREETPNVHHPEITDVIHRFIYPGMRVRFYEAVSTGEEYVTTVVLTGERYILPFGIRVGMSGDRLRRVLGQPHFQQEGRWYYSNALYDRGEPPKSFSCAVRGNTVTEIELTLE